MTSEPVLEAHDLRKVYVGGDGAQIEVLSGLEFSLREGEFVAIVGASGSGKSTLLQLLGALDGATGGSIGLEGRSFADESAEGLATIRNQRIGFVFQFHHLLRDFTALENVMFPLLIAGASRSTAQARAVGLLESVGLGHRMSHPPAQLSGGEQQRAAVARALVCAPAVVLADEPSGNLDHANAERLHDLLIAMVRERNAALLVVTHNYAFASRADRILTLAEGRLHPAVGAEAPS